MPVCVPLSLHRVTTLSPSAMHDSIAIRESGNPVVKAVKKPDHPALSNGSFAPDR